MGWIGRSIRWGRVLLDKIRTGERWYDKHIAEPMLAEVEAAKEGSLPGEYGSRDSQWDEAVSTPAQRKVSGGIRAAAENYTEALNRVASLEEKRISTAKYFIEDLPGGGVSGTDVQIISQCTKIAGSRGPAEARPEHGDFDSWLIGAWPSFENSNSAEGFKRRVECLAQNPENILDPDVFECWEDQLGEHGWPDAFWRAYENEYLPRYRRTLCRLEKAHKDTMIYANEVDALIESRI